MTSDDNTQNEAIATPLRRYTFGSKVGMLPTTLVKDRRTSLLELFQKTKIAEENIDPIISNKKNQTEKSTVNSEKTTLKKRSSIASVGTIDAASADEKLHKVNLFFLYIYNP